MRLRNPVAPAAGIALPLGAGSLGLIDWVAVTSSGQLVRWRTGTQHDRGLDDRLPCV